MAYLVCRGEDSTRFVTASWDATMHVFDLTRKELDKFAAQSS